MKQGLSTMQAHQKHISQILKFEHQIKNEITGGKNIVAVMKNPLVQAGIVWVTIGIMLLLSYIHP